ncbi:ribonuclease HII [Sporosarcina sp. NCCP-2716]|uniref:ribonuclease HII n=1 Tax=Sporosarcina sp. NCCP-2716 TaxID=2943679 RepID=UPI00203B3F40|nr:ribonuclease HII [Sporosarcina sp. NCCP-2716]GKV67780.1 ribonuclease HII [Sporosarcina sp. NCCP-2716]
MKTIQLIKEELKAAAEPAHWMDELEHDPRSGVQQALKSWRRAYEKRCVQISRHRDKVQFDLSYAPFSGALGAGTDEAGRGPLAGPVVTAAVILPADTDMLIGLDDSKQISIRERERLADLIRQAAVAWSVHIQPAERIDEVNIYAATRESMEQSIYTLSVKPDYVMADAMPLSVGCPSASIVKGDAQSLAIAAASILAKTTRDRLMTDLHSEYPMYGFDKHAGYGTREHVEALRQHGPCPHHRKTFEPVKTMLAGKEEDR